MKPCQWGYVWNPSQHRALSIVCLLTQSGKDCHLAYSQISFTHHTNRHVASSDWRFTFLCPGFTSSKLSHSVTAHWVLLVVSQDTDADFKIRQRTRLRTCAWKKCCSANYLFTIKGGYCYLPVRHCGQTILSTAECQRATHFKVSPRRNHMGTREIHEIIQYTPRKLYRSYAPINVKLQGGHLLNVNFPPLG